MTNCIQVNGSWFGSWDWKHTHQVNGLIIHPLFGCLCIQSFGFLSSLLDFWCSVSSSSRGAYSRLLCYRQCVPFYLLTLAIYTDGRSQGTNDGDVKLLHPIESSTESSCFGSSVHYGGRDFYVSPPPSIDASEASKSVSHIKLQST